MTQEEKRLLLVDLCGRSSYGVKVNINSPIEEQNRMELFDVNLEAETIGVRNEKWMFRAVPVENEDGWIVRPYLRRMSSMTYEEREEAREKFFDGSDHYDIDDIGEIYADTYQPYTTVYTLSFARLSGYMDWLDAHYLDYRGLIDKGLADEALEGMYGESEKWKVPKTVAEAVSMLGRILSDEDREYLLENGAISMHDSLGRWIRNEWGLWTGSELKDELMNMNKGLDHPDDMSNYIIEEFIKYWNNIQKIKKP